MRSSGKVLRGERGSVASLTPLYIKRLAPVLGISEATLLARAGHLSEVQAPPSAEQVILGDPDLVQEDKELLNRHLPAVEVELRLAGTPRYGHRVAAEVGRCLPGAVQPKTDRNIVERVPPLASTIVSLLLDASDWSHRTQPR